MRVHVSNTLDDLTSDLRKVAVTARRDMVGVVSEGIRTGASVARDLTKELGGSHSGVSKKTGRVQPLVKSITHEMKLYGALGGLIVGEYGPDEAKRQARVMRVLEHGNATTPPKRIMGKSADLIGPSFGAEVRRLPDRWFWPNG